MGNGWRCSSWIYIALGTLPLLGLLYVSLPSMFGLPGMSDGWGYLELAAVFWNYLSGSVLLALIVCAGSLLLGLPSAVLLSFFDFPLSKFFKYALVLPLFTPAYVLGYVYVEWLDFFGPIQTTLRAIFGPDAHLPSIYNIWGASFVLTLTNYPYVYLLLHAALTQQCQCSYDASLCLGHSHWQTVKKICLPMCKNIVLWCLFIVALETISDFGVAEYFSIQTLSVGIYTLWIDTGQEQIGALFALLLLGMSAVLWVLQNKSPYLYHHMDTQKTYKAPLTGVKGALCSIWCALILMFSLVIPIAFMVYDSLHYVDSWATSQVITATLNTLLLAAVSVVILLLLGGYFSYTGKLCIASKSRKLARLMMQTVYGLPSIVIAFGIMACLQVIGQVFPSILFLAFQTIAGLVLVYCVRFTGVTVGMLDNQLHKISSNITDVACTLSKPGPIVGRLLMPSTRGSIYIIAIYMCAEIVKELPIALIMRPVDFDTLSTFAHRFASDQRIYQAAPGALLMMIVSMLPALVYLCYTKVRNRVRNSRKRTRVKIGHKQWLAEGV